MNFITLNRRFFERNPELVARYLLGSLLVRKIGNEIYCGKIVETEAYLSENDPAAHSYKGITPRTQVLMGPAGHAYIYQIHRYHCLNVVSDKKGRPGCVLIRGLEPLTRNFDNTNGPGKLCRELQISKKLYGVDMTLESSDLYIARGFSEKNIITSKRVGITKATDLTLRYYIADNEYVSR